VENDRVFCVNRIVHDAGNNRELVATANGLVIFDSAARQKQVLTKADGLIADHVTDVALRPDGMTLATPAGLTFIDGTGARSLYAFHGLVNNHVDALGSANGGRRLVAGTLGGLSILDDDRVAVSYTTATSTLKHNWITALVPLGNRWMVGTYGAGVMLYDHNGFHSLETASGDMVVNPNAMLATEGLVLAGTLGKGLLVFHRATERWTVVEAGLPSLNVTALAAGNGYIYIGTDNGLVRIPENNLN